MNIEQALSIVLQNQRDLAKAIVKLAYHNPDAARAILTNIEHRVEPIIGPDPYQSRAKQQRRSRSYQNDPRDDRYDASNGSRKIGGNLDDETPF